jgi:hypothetical protein
MLNTAKTVRFQCYGFFVSRNHPVETVAAFASHDQLRAALKDGRLLDITGHEDAASGTSKVLSAIDGAVKDGTIEPPAIQETESRFFMGKDSRGNSYIIAPKDDADYERMFLCHQHQRSNHVSP